MTAWRFLFLSLCIHLLIWAFFLNRQGRSLDLNQDKPVEVAIVDKNPAKHARAKPRMIVRQALPPLSMLKPDPPKEAKYLSERDQAVVKEMQSKVSGLTQNRAHQVAANQELANNANDKTKSRSQNRDQVPDQLNDRQRETDPDGEKTLNQKRLEKMGRQIMAETSTSGEYLPEVADGAITALNTERFMYYSFFSRVEERIRPLWERNVQDTHDRLPGNTQKQLQSKNWITGLEILLNPEGHYVGTKVQQGSGVDAIDRDAIEAFHEAEFFPNPPKEMLQADGFIHLKYVFIVQQTSSIWARRSSD